jgi:hypothetical protein
MKKTLKVLLILPFAFIWDVYFFTLTQIYVISQYIEDTVGKKVSDLIDK